MASRTKGGDAAALLGVWALRSSSEYRAAELLRRTVGSSREMASDPKTKEYAAARLLIGTWDAIAAMVFQGDLPKDKVLASMPICDMWRALVDAIEMIRREKDGAGYAANFELLYKASQPPKKGKQARKYSSGDCSGIHLLFG